MKTRLLKRLRRKAEEWIATPCAFYYMQLYQGMIKDSKEAKRDYIARYIKTLKWRRRK
jgi:hypothetical protein